MKNLLRLTLILVGGFISVTMAHRDVCSVGSPPQERLAKDVRRMRKYKERSRRLDHSQRRRTSLGFWCRDCVWIEMVFHIIAGDNGEGEDIGKWTDDAIDGEIDRLNLYFEKTRFRFKHKRTTRTQNSKWADADLDDKDTIDAMTEALRIGGSDVANIFVSDGSCETTAGWGQYPWDRGFTPADQYYSDDRVHVCAEYIGGDDVNAYDTLLAHEMGHWLGLMHTYEGRNCDKSNDNDHVDDTPQHADRPEKGCPLSQDSCPNRPGKDPVANFMNTPGRCRSEFTWGQVDRMYAQFNEYRRRIDPCEEDEIEATFEVKFDGSPEDNEVAFVDYSDLDDRDWTDWKETDDDEKFNFANKKSSKQICLSKRTMYAFIVRDIAENGLQWPGYVSLMLDEKEIVKESGFDEEWAATFVIPDVCSSREVRLTLDVTFGGGSDDISWAIRNTNTSETVVSRDETARYTDIAYRRLYYERCLPAGNTTYEFKMYDADGGNGPESYKLYMNGNEVYAGEKGVHFGDDSETVFIFAESASFRSFGSLAVSVVTSALVFWLSFV